MENVRLVKAALEKHVNFERQAQAPRYFKTGQGQYGEGDQFLGVANPDLRAVAKKYWKQVTDIELAKLLNDPLHEVRLTALFMLVTKFEKEKVPAEKEKWVNLYLNNLEKVNNWDLVDSSAHKILGAWLADKPRDILYTFANNGDLWKQRIAIIATHHFIRKNDFKDTLAIAEILLHHPHDLIHKAVGWMLREVGGKSQETEENFLQKHYKTMPRTALRYAIEKFPEVKRKSYLYGTI